MQAWVQETKHAGTDDGLEIKLGSGAFRNLDVVGRDDFEAGNKDTFELANSDGYSGLQAVTLKARGSDGVHLRWISYQFAGDSVCYVPTSYGANSVWDQDGIWLDGPCSTPTYDNVDCFALVEVKMVSAATCDPK